MSIENKEQKHSGLGIASFSIIIGVIISIFLLYFIGRWISQDSTDWFMILYLYASPFISLVALGLGIGGLKQKNRKKIFAILGTIFSVVVLICSCASLFVWINAMVG